MLRQVFSRPVRWCAAGLCLSGTGLAALAVVPAFRRLGTGQGVAFLAVAVGLAAFALAVLRGWRWALVLCGVAMGGQVFAVAGTVAELVLGVDEAKAGQLRLLGFDPVAAVVVNLVYAIVGVALSGWLAVRWLRWRATAKG